MIYLHFHDLTASGGGGGGGVKFRKIYKEIMKGAR